MSDYFERLLGLTEDEAFPQSEPSSLHPVPHPRADSTVDDDLAWGELVEEIGTEQPVKEPAAAAAASLFTGAPSPAASSRSRPSVVGHPEPSEHRSSPGSTLTTGSRQEVSESGMVRAAPEARECTESESPESKSRTTPVPEGPAPAVPSTEAVIQQVLKWVATAPSLPPIPETSTKPADAGVPAPAPAPAATTPHTFPDLEPLPTPAVLPLPAVAWDPETAAAAHAPAPPRLAIHIGAVHVTVETPRSAPGISPPPAPAPLPPRLVLRSGSRLSRHYVSSSF